MAVGAFKILGHQAAKNLPKQKNLKKRLSEIDKDLLATQAHKKPQRQFSGPYIVSEGALGGKGGGWCRNSRSIWRFGNQSTRKAALEKRPIW